MSDGSENIQEVSEIVSPFRTKQEGPSLEELIKLLNTERLNYLRDMTTDKIKSLQEMQERVELLQALLQKINALTDKDGKVDFSKDTSKGMAVDPKDPTIGELLDKAKELGVKWDKDSTKLTRDEKDQLVSNIRMTIDNFNVKNDMALQEITRLTNERYESYQIARSILKPLDDAKKSMARAMRGG